MGKPFFTGIYGFFYGAGRSLKSIVGGEAGIRTLGGLAPSLDFESSPFGRSGTSPWRGIIAKRVRLLRPDKSHRKIERVDRLGELAH